MNKEGPHRGGNTRADNISGSIEFRGYDLCQLALLATADCHLGGLGVCILILWVIFFISGERWGVILATRGHPGRPWEQQDGHGVVGNMIFIDFGVILEPVYSSFLNSGRSKPYSFSGLIPEGVLY